MLLLLPNLIGEHAHHQLFLPASVDRAVLKLDGLIAESERGGRRYLGRFETKKPAAQIPISELNEHTKEADYDFLLKPVKEGECWGLVSDAGLPCIADPGAGLVARAKQIGIVIQAFSGPSAIFLSLMLSGLPGQRFAFHGYFQQDKLMDWTNRSKQDNATQLFIEAPYRNRKTLDYLLLNLPAETQLCIAWDLTLPSQSVLTQSIANWKKSPLPNINKKPAMFLMLIV